jgi:hypothetical protein
MKKLVALSVLLLAFAAVPAYAQSFIPPGGVPFSCFMEAVTVTTQCQAAPGTNPITSQPGKIYVAAYVLSNEAGTANNLDIVFGTGSNCATGTGALTHKHQFLTQINATETVSPAFLILPPGTALCVRPSAATAFGATIMGYVAP